MGGMGCCIQVLGSRDSALSAALCGMLPNIVMAAAGEARGVLRSGH